MKLISWNVNGRVKVATQQALALGRREPHVVALQDIRVSAISDYQNAFAQLGLPYLLHTFQEGASPKPTGVLIASCFQQEILPALPFSTLWPNGTLSPHQEKASLHWARRTLFVALQTPWGKIELHNVYITPANHDETTKDGRRRYPTIKLDLLSALYQTLIIPSQSPRSLCGDFNTPQHEYPTGEIVTWGSDRKKRGGYRLSRPEQDRIERAVLAGLTSYDLADAYRRVHGYSNCDSDDGWSWKSRSKAYRFDHLFASAALSPKSILYLQDIYQLGLSDHVPLEGTFEICSG